MFYIAIYSLNIYHSERLYYIYTVAWSHFTWQMVSACMDHACLSAHRAPIAQCSRSLLGPLSGFTLMTRDPNARDVHVL